MEVKTSYIKCGCICSVCSHNWIGIFEADTIKWGEYSEIKVPDKAECPNCGQYTNDIIFNSQLEMVTINNHFFKLSIKEKRGILWLVIKWALNEYFKTIKFA